MAEPGAEAEEAAAAAAAFPPGTPQWRHTTSLPFFFAHVGTRTCVQRSLPKSCPGVQAMFDDAAHHLSTQPSTATQIAHRHPATATTPQRLNDPDAAAGARTTVRRQLKPRFKLVERKREGATREPTWHRLLDWLAWNGEPTFRRVMQTLREALQDEQETAHEDTCRHAPRSLRFDGFEYSPKQDILLTPTNPARPSSPWCSREPPPRAAKRVRFGPSLCLDGSDLRRLVSVADDDTVDVSRRKRPRAGYVFRVQGSHVLHIGGSRPLPAPCPAIDDPACSDAHHPLASVFSVPPAPLSAAPHPPRHTEDCLTTMHASSDIARSAAGSDGDLVPTPWPLDMPWFDACDAPKRALEFDHPSTQPIAPHPVPPPHFCIPSPPPIHHPPRHNAPTIHQSLRNSSTVAVLRPCNQFDDSSPCSGRTTALAAPQASPRRPLADLNHRNFGSEDAGYGCGSNAYQRLPAYGCSLSPPTNAQPRSRPATSLFAIKSEPPSPRTSDWPSDPLPLSTASPRQQHPHRHVLFSCPCPMLSSVSLPSFASSCGERTYALSDAFVKHTGTVEHPVLKQVALLGRSLSCLVSQAPDVILARYVLEMSNYVDEKTYGKLVHALCKLWRKVAADAFDKENVQAPARSVATRGAQQLHSAAGRLLHKEQARMAARQRRNVSSLYSTLQHLRCWLVTHDYLELPCPPLLPTPTLLPR